MASSAVAAAASSSCWSTWFRSQMASARLLKAEPVLGEPGDRKRACDCAQRDDELLVVDLNVPGGRLDSNESLLFVEADDASSRSSACGHIIGSGTTTCLGSSVPDAASGSIGVYSMKFSRLTIVAPALPR